ncbi:MAG: hypothetical protein WC833_08670 [Bacteroidales bacterium]
MKQITPLKQIEQYLQQGIDRNEKVVLNAFAYVGEQCILEARGNGDYMDQTGNLRSSIGYVLLKNGRVIRSGGFEQVKGATDGVKEGTALTTKLISENGRGIVLIVVAGMKYAAYVEALNRNVLTSAELLSERLVPEIMNKLGFSRR